MSTDKSSAAIREFAEKWCLKVIEVMKGDDYIMHDLDGCLSDLTALISEKQAEYFEFAKWIGFESSRLYYRDLDEKWIRTIFIIDENPHEEYDEYTTEELFEYWKTNEQ